MDAACGAPGRGRRIVWTSPAFSACRQRSNATAASSSIVLTSAAGRVLNILASLPGTHSNMQAAKTYARTFGRFAGEIEQFAGFSPDCSRRRGWLKSNKTVFSSW